MDCIKSFTAFSNTIITLNTSGGDSIRSWNLPLTGENQFIAVIDASGVGSRLNIEGYKKIDVYGIDIVGSVLCPQSGTFASYLVHDWFFDVAVVGQSSPISAKTTLTNPFQIQVNKNPITRFSLGKYINQAKFSSPITGVSEIQFSTLTFQGINATGFPPTESIRVQIELAFNIHYRYDGE